MQATPRFLNGVFAFAGTGYDKPAKIDDSLSYVVPADKRTQLIYLRAGNSCAELIYVVPTAPGLRRLPFDWQWRHTQLGLAHQSNGQSDPLSRSWNRVYIGGGFERSPWVLTARVNKRVTEPISSDNNPDLVPFRGRGEFQLGWAGGLQKECKRAAHQGTSR